MVDVVKTAVDVANKAFFIVAGYFVAKVVVGVLARSIPQLGAFANWSILALGILGSVYTQGVIQDLSLGASILAAVNIMEDLFAPFLMQFKVSRVG